MDMMQLVSLLLIPTLREQQEHRSEENENDLLKYSLEMMLHDVTGSRAPKPLTKTLVKQILQAYGETGLSEDEELIREMLKQAGRKAYSHDPVLLNAETFCRALTGDVQNFSTENKDKLSTNLDDALFSETTPKNTDKEKSARSSRFKRYESVTPTVFEQERTVEDIPMVYTAPHIDNTAGTSGKTFISLCRLYSNLFKPRSLQTRFGANLWSSSSGPSLYYPSKHTFLCTPGATSWV